MVEVVVVVLLFFLGFFVVVFFERERDRKELIGIIFAKKCRIDV